MLSISVSLVAVFIPLLFMQGQVGRLFREFAVTLSAAVLISLVISLTTTPMMCAWLLPPGGAAARAKPRGPARALGRARLRQGAVVVRGEPRLGAGEPAASCSSSSSPSSRLNVYLFSAAPKGFFPQQDTGQIQGGLRADQSISSQAMGEKLRQVVNIIRRDPAVATVVGFTGGGRAGGGFMFVNLKPQSERTERGQAVIARLRPQLAQVTGLSIFLNTGAGRARRRPAGNSTYQYTLKSDNLADLRRWATRLAEEMKQDAGR